MKLVKVKEVPSRVNHKIWEYLNEFMQMNTAVVRVEIADGEYKCVANARGSFDNAIKRIKIPVKTMTREGKLYLIRTDM